MIVLDAWDEILAFNLQSVFSVVSLISIVTKSGSRLAIKFYNDRYRYSFWNKKFTVGNYQTGQRLGEK